MSDLYLRKIRVTFKGGAGLIINPANEVTIRDEMRIAFEVEKGLSGTANTAILRIWNLKESNRNAVGKEFDEVEIEAGYISNIGGKKFGLIYRGAIRDIQHDRDNTDIITTVTCGDGDKALRKAVINKSYPKNTPVKTVLEDLAAELEKDGITRGEWKLPDDLPTMARPYAACGSCTRELDRLGRAFQFYWSSQNQKLEIVPGDDAFGTVVLINQQSGMIGSPAITDNGVVVKVLLNPEIRVGHKVKVESEHLEMNGANGEFRVSQLNFAGDNRGTGDDHFVEIHGEAIKDSKVDEGRKK